MSLQKVIESAVNIEINRSKLVAQSVSRSGRILTAARNWANPFRFTVTPRPIWSFPEFRDEIEVVMAADRLDTHTIEIGKVGTIQTDYRNWMTAYQGNMALDLVGNFYIQETVFPGLNDPTIASFSGTTLVLNVPSANLGKQLVKVGDYIQPGSTGGSYNHPYIVSAVTNNGIVNASTMTITTHRPYIPMSGVTIVGQRLGAGSHCKFYVKVTKLPNVRFLPGRLVEFTGDFELIEELPII